MTAPVVQNQAMYQNVTDEEAMTTVSDKPPYMHGKISREEVDALVRSNGFSEGLFLVRESARTPGDYALSVVAQGKLQHFKISRKTGLYRIDDGPGFGSLDELVQFYRNPDDRLPTVLVRFCASTVSASELQQYQNHWNASLPTAGGITAGMARMSTTAPAASSPASVIPVGVEGPYAASPLMNPDGRMVNPPAPSAAPSAAVQQGINVQEREGFRNIPRVKEWFDRDDQIQQVDIKIKEEETKKPADLQNAAADRADEHMKMLSEAALAEEKMYLVWINDHLEQVGMSPVSDLTDSLKNGVAVIKALESVSKETGIKPPHFHKNPRAFPQEIDNWNIVIKYMRKLGIPVDEEGTGEEYVAPLDPAALHNADRREMLKLFSKLLMYEASLSPF
ncbi:uncharacterized protein MONBRDRAFT_33487 [Monosiga brevicollis MX1]|uniref:SH2 domain-containing protein n=1 Tax=Monosiga brevicollis TaxID=81824 RepID=A9V5M9_MONBE|nr:uncharacterized protein MONBRDRAFT_33487 [Monosiga brevicollis MX1]EDQ87146.1 predicted protein [Monosiga brevicollis MX1]|eukprot:XP_001748089.1 hypothetical protein [Monosiga brevicollis MX1]